MILIVIPCYREANRLPVADYKAFYEAHTQVSFCLVNDGSKDATLGVLQTLQKGRTDRIMVLDLPQNVGKGEAVRQGLLAGMAWKDFDAVAFFDADLATPLEEVFLLQTELNQGNYQMAFGSRLMRIGSTIERKASRHYFGRVFATAARWVVPLPIYDTQCGAKLFRPTLAKAVCQEPFMSRWLFDLEIFARIVQLWGKEKAEKSLIEVPLRTWIEKGDSRLTFRYLLKVPFELWRIRKKYQK